MKTEKKYIKLGEPYIEDEVIKVVVEDQSHRGIEFGNETRVDYKDGIPNVVHSETVFKASNGVTLLSSCIPSSFYTWGTGVFVRGSVTSLDIRPIKFTSLNGYNKFVEAVNEYNEYFSKPKVKEMTMKELCKELGYEVKIKKEC